VKGTVAVLVAVTAMLLIRGAELESGPLAQGAGTPPAASPAGGEKLLLGFEKGELAGLAAPGQTRGETPDGYGLSLWRTQPFVNWTCKKTQTTEGEFALVRTHRKLIDPSEFQMKPPNPEPIQTYSPSYGWGPATAGRNMVFASGGFFHSRAVPADWSASQFLRFDVQTTMPETTLSVFAEDEDVDQEGDSLAVISATSA